MIDELMAHLPRVLEVRDAVGWNPAVWERLPTKLMCVISELDELSDALAAHPAQYTRHGIDARAEELADVTLYLLCILDDVFDGKVARGVGKPAHPFRDPCALTKPARSYVVRAFEAWRHNDPKDAGVCIELAIVECCRLARGLGIDLPAVAAAKTEINATRPPRHGGKHPDS